MPDESRSKAPRAAEPPSTAGSWARAPGVKDTLDPRDGLEGEKSPGGGKRESTSTGAVMPAIRSPSDVERARSARDTEW